MLRLNTSERIKVVLKDINDNFKTGLVAADFLNSRVQITKGDGSTSFINLVLNTNLFEVDTTNSPGLYEILLSTTDTNTLGQLTVSIQPSTSAFLALFHNMVVQVNLSTIDTNVSNVYSRIGAPVSTSISADIANVQSTTDLIKAKTDNLPSTPANESSVTTAITNITNTYNRIGAPTNASIAADIAAVKSDTNDIVSKLPATTISSASDVSSSVTTINSHVDTKFGGIEGAGFSTLTDSLKVISDNIDALNVSVDPSTIISSIKGPQGISISDIAGGVSFIPSTDNLHAISSVTTNTQSTINSQPNIWDEVRSLHVAPGSFGEAIRILVQVAKGHIKIDTLSNSLKVYQENGTDILFECPLLRKGLPASVFSDERLAAL